MALVVAEWPVIGLPQDDAAMRKFEDLQELVRNSFFHFPFVFGF